MRIRGNWTSLLSWRSLTTANNKVETSMARVSSGLRVNSAADDAAGLSRSMRVKGQFSGLARANRNALDGVSLVGTAESALNEVHALLHRGRVLALQAANGTLGDAERVMLQREMEQLLAEVDRVSDGVTFNGQRLLKANGSSAAMGAAIEGLRSGWLEQSEALVLAQYGLLGDGVTLRVQFESGGTESVWISGDPNGMDGKLENLTLHVNLFSFETGGTPDGGSGPIYSDRKIARAMAQAVLARNSDYASLLPWFISGTSDFLAGGNERLSEAVSTYGAASVVAAIDTWANDDLHAASAYLAVRYLDSLLPPFSMAAVMQELSWGNDLDSALLNTIGLDTASFVNDFKLNGAAFLGTLSLAGPDVGAIGGGDAQSVVANGGTYSVDPLAGFELVWPNAAEAEPVVLHLQVGANAHQMLRVLIPEVSTWSLNLIGINLVTRPQSAITVFDAAIDQLSQTRAYLGAVTNRLEHIMRSNGESGEAQMAGYSRIMHLDVAHELTNMTRHQILVSSSAAVLAQSNTVRQHVMWLLKDLRPPGLQPIALPGGNLTN